ncbi:MAG: membrane dipeptidase [Mariniblastus sp.]|nr:membrane dipeptidase [Mariniblastus sp.]
MRFLIFITAVLSFASLTTAQDHSTQPAGDNISKEAMEIHASGMLFDGHNDLPWAMRTQAGSSFDNIDIAKPTKLHTDIPRLRKGGLKAQFWSVYVPAGTDRTGKALIETLEQIQLVHDMCERYPDVFEMADKAADIERISKAGKIASMIGVEGGHSIQNSLQVLRELYDRGARYMTLTHSKTLAWADSATDDPKNNGLSPFGKEVVREMNRLGMLVDLSHVSPKCMQDALEVTQAPVIFSHSSARAICDVPRNVPDDVLKLTAKNGGVVMINFYSGFVVPTDQLPKSQTAPKKFGDVNTICDHIDHVAKIAGIDHVGIGSDYDGVSSLPVGLKDVSGYPNITQELLNRGYTQEKIHKVLGGNVLRALKQAEQVSARLTKQRTAKHQGQEVFKLTIAAGKVDRKNCLVRGLVDPGQFSKNTVTLASPDGTLMLGQLSAPRLGISTKANQKEIAFVIPSLAAGQELELSARDSGLNPNTNYKWHDDGSNASELYRNQSPVMKFIYEAVDDSTADRRYTTMKVFHHVYTPDGSRLMTKGPGDGSFAKLKNHGLFPHHRGLFYGFNRITYEKNGKSMKADVWHCNQGESQTHEKTLSTEAGPVFGRHTNVIYWRGRDGQPFAHEIREMSAYEIAGTTLIEFRSSLDSVVGPLGLRGDPQHAGFQFRASQDIPDQTKNKTYYIRPDGIGKPGKFRNWSGKKNESQTNLNHINLPWNTVVIELPVKLSARATRSKGIESEMQKFSISYLDAPTNPKPSRYSERDYARFGSYFEFDLDSDKLLNLNYQVWIQNGVTDIDAVNAASKNFNEPVLLKQD